MAESRARARKGPPAIGAATAYLVAGLVFAGHLAFGANRTNLSLGFFGLWFLVLAGLLLATRWAPVALDRARLGAVAAVFAAVVALSALSLTPFSLGGVHPIWSYTVDAPRVGALDPYATRIELLKLCGLGAVFVIGALFGGDDERAKTLLRALLTVGLAFSAWAFVDHIVNPNLLFGGLRSFGPDRLSAAFGSGNTAGALFGALTLLGLTDVVRAYQAESRSDRMTIRRLQRLIPSLARPLIGLALAVTCLILTLSRAGLIATSGAAVLLVGAMALSRARKDAVSVPMIATSLILVGFVGASLALNLDAIGQRFTVFGQDSLVRGAILKAHWAAFLAAPWGGYGLGGFARINGMIMDRSNFDALNTIGAAHNLYLQWLEEGGVVAAAAMLAVMLLITGRLCLGVFRRRGVRAWLLALLAVLLLFALYGASDYALQTPSMAIFFSLLMGIGHGLSAQAIARPAPAPPSPARATGRRRPPVSVMEGGRA